MGPGSDGASAPTEVGARPLVTLSSSEYIWLMSEVFGLMRRRTSASRATDSSIDPGDAGVVTATGGASVVGGDLATAGCALRAGGAAGGGLSGSATRRLAGPT